MSEKILVPVLGESITEATVAKWLKKEGDSVAADEAIVELETDYIQWTLETINANNKEISYIGRSPDASPATGFAKRHISQQQEIINKVFE